MPAIDLPLAQLETYRSAAVAPDDFDGRWAATLAEARAVPMVPVVTPVTTGLKLVDVFDVTFPGFGGDRREAGHSARSPVCKESVKIKHRRPHRIAPG